jgi:TolA-binding protein
MFQAMLIVDMDKYLNKYPGLAAKYIAPLIIRQKRSNWAMSCVQKLQNKMFPHLDIEDDKASKKSQECEMTQMKEQLRSMQDTLEEIKQSLQRQAPPVMKNKEFLQRRRYTML